MAGPPASQTGRLHRRRLSLTNGRRGGRGRSEPLAIDGAIAALGPRASAGDPLGSGPASAIKLSAQHGPVLPVGRGPVGF